MGNYTVAMDLFTIGHSNHTVESFVALLHQHGVTAIGDVRSSPYSRYVPHFNQAAFQQILKQEGIAYVFLGQELGARSENPACYVNGKALYEKIAATDEFQSGLERVLQGAKKHRIALMCAEKDPLTCHRAVLVCQHLRQFDLNINHILKDGNFESHSELEERMLRKHRFTEFAQPVEPVQLSLFEVAQSSDLPTKEEALKKAYELQGDEIAYVDKWGKYHDKAS